MVSSALGSQLLMIALQTINISVMSVVLLLIIGPLAQAFVRGVASARDPRHRVVPQSPWFFFDRAYSGRRFTRWFVIWRPTLGILFALMVVLQFVNSKLPFSVWNLFFIVGALLSVFVGSWFIAKASFYYWAPRCAKLWTLSVIGGLSAIFVYITFFIVITLLLPDGILVVEASVLNLEYARTSSSLLPIYAAPICYFAARAMERWARGRGESWFRFEESAAVHGRVDHAD